MYKEFLFSPSPYDWLIWSCSSSCFFNASGITICLLFRMTLSIASLSSWHVQCGLRFCAMLSMFSGHPFVICSFSCFKWLSRAVSCCSSCIVIHSGMFEAVYTVLTFTFIPDISSSLSSLWFVWIASLQWSYMGQACILFWLYIGVFWGVLAVVFAIMLPHLSWILPPVACGL